MISQISNNKPSGYQSIDCDAGIPISGRTASNGSYQILKLSDAGSLLVKSGVSATSVNYQIESLVPVVTGAIGVKAVSIFLGNFNVIPTAISEGWYTISPSFIAQANSGGSITALLVKVGSIIESYSATLNAGTDGFDATINQLTQGGLACVWHNLPLTNRIGNGVMTATGGNSNTLEKNVYLEAGAYNLVIIVDTAITTNSSGLVVASIQTIVQNA